MDQKSNFLLYDISHIGDYNNLFKNDYKRVNLTSSQYHKSSSMTQNSQITTKGKNRDSKMSSEIPEKTLNLFYDNEYFEKMEINKNFEKMFLDETAKHQSSSLMTNLKMPKGVWIKDPQTEEINSLNVVQLDFSYENKSMEKKKMKSKLSGNSTKPPLNISQDSNINFYNNKDQENFEDPSDDENKNKHIIIKKLSKKLTKKNKTILKNKRILDVSSATYNTNDKMTNDPSSSLSTCSAPSRFKAQTFELADFAEEKINKELEKSFLESHFFNKSNFANVAPTIKFTNEKREGLIFIKFKME